MRIGITLPLATGDAADGVVPSFEVTRDFALRAEAAGLDSVWVFDHLIFRFPGEPDEGLHEAWTTLAALAPIVPRVELGALVMCSSFRNAALMAKMAGTLDDLSGGRLILGLGSGWHEAEYRAFGFPFDHRVSRFAEDLEVIARLLRGETVSLEGEYRHYEAAELIPRPHRQAPILVAAKGPRMLELTARWADAWNTAWFGRVDDLLRRRNAELDEACDRVGRDPRSIRRTVGLRVHEPGRLGDDARGTDASEDGLADLFDELAAEGFADGLIWSLEKSPAALERISRARELHLARS
ncbi:MAG: LLM class flavin-dependent oxidoreductase [Chloroflexi bacterium]|nr:LLM class flavin-dependent oxidoreductase [Chloroflexota bacterium]